MIHMNLKKSTQRRLHVILLMTLCIVNFDGMLPALNIEYWSTIGSDELESTFQTRAYLLKNLLNRSASSVALMMITFREFPLVRSGALPLTFAPEGLFL